MEQNEAATNGEKPSPSGRGSGPHALHQLRIDAPDPGLRDGASSSATSADSYSKRR